MKISEVLGQVNHRPWPMPKDSWRYYQEWNHVLFLHWKVDPDVLRSWVPKELELDLFEGVAWVSLVAFDMDRIRPAYLPAIWPISNFLEINVRTYVSCNGKGGVYFLSIEASNKVSCWIARRLSGLPYRYSKMGRSEKTFFTKNKKIGHDLMIHYEVGQEQTKKSDLDTWLTERYSLFQDTPEHVNSFQIHHIEWPINFLEISSFKVSFRGLQTLISDIPDLCHYSPGVQVLSWDREKFSRGS